MEPVRVAAAVHAFVVVEDRGPCLAEEADAADHLVAVLGVEFDDAAFLGGEGAVLAEHPGGHAEFADVVQDAGEADDVEAVLGHAELTGDQDGGVTDAFAVAPGVPVLDVDGLDEGADGGLVGGALAVVLGEDPAGDVHGEEDEERRDGPVGAAPEDGHHQSGEAVDGVRGEGPAEEAAPGGPRGSPLAVARMPPSRAVRTRQKARAAAAAGSSA